MVGEGEASKLVREAEAGPVVDPRRVPEVKEAIRRLYEDHRVGRKSVEPRSEVVDRFDRRLIAGRFAELLDDAVGAK
jgi:glycosyltransferase involved in cell wall biosynthesis